MSTTTKLIFDVAAAIDILVNNVSNYFRYDVKKDYKGVMRLKKLITANINSYNHVYLNDLIKHAADADLYAYRDAMDSVIDHFNIPYEVLDSFLLDNQQLSFIFEHIDNVVIHDGFEIWVLIEINGLFFYENYGDYRILEWTKEHIRDGRYINKKRLSGNASHEPRIKSR